MIKRLLLLAFLLPTVSPVWADKIIMKDGKIYQGHIMGETRRSVLISNPPVDPKPRFIELKDVMTIVRESRPDEKRTFEDGRYASVHLGIGGKSYSSDEFSFPPAAHLTLGGAFRMHPFVEAGVEVNLVPALSGSLVVTDGTNTRSYEKFSAYDGGFSLKFFPFFRYTEWRAEPYLTSGYHFARLNPKGSGDSLSGRMIFGGLGILFPWWKPLYWDVRLVYENTAYDSIEFMSGEGDLEGVSHSSVSGIVGLAYRFL